MVNAAYGDSAADNPVRLAAVAPSGGPLVDRNYAGGDNAISRLTSLSDGPVTVEGDSYSGQGTGWKDGGARGSTGSAAGWEKQEANGLALNCLARAFIVNTGAE
jgi:hypothetical protein